MNYENKPISVYVNMEADMQAQPMQPTDRERIEELENTAKELVQTIVAIRKAVGI